ncbi:hypothetical protein BXZ70DRAFT_1606 [Cristinia sonorae]|uniref:N-acetyltransferase domain-containing protein n=1 Tax=Cristinia sonorae TaxID=1940300 RepID=A0A8K0XUQ4_9AGAR|nr:hypothetical protein BXZ70DRAFT_1606 [Cristinia sonorae]
MMEMRSRASAGSEPSRTRRLLILVGIGSSDPAKPQRRKHKALGTVLQFLTRHLVHTAEQNRRSAEFSRKMRPALEEALGDRLASCISLDFLATLPDKQGHGYGSALCNIVTAEADARNMETFLISSNVAANTVFYNQFGFFTEKTFFLGEDDPTWKKDPVPIAIMVRGPRGSREVKL